MPKRWVVAVCASVLTSLGGSTAMANDGAAPIANGGVSPITNGASLPIANGSASMAIANDGPYHTHSQINERLTALAAKYKNASIVRITKTTEGREVLALEVDADGKLSADDPVLMLHGGIHGNEWISTEVVLHLAELTLASGGTFLSGVRIHFVPVVNVDGYATGKRTAVDTDGTRYDPNRDFPVPYASPQTKSRGLISAFRRYAKRGRLVAVLDYHAPTECTMWPWAFSRTRQPADVAELKNVVEQMARSVGYCFGQTAKIIAYRHQGTAQDYFAFTHNAAAVLMELGRLRGPERDYAAQELIEQERPFRIFLNWVNARYGRSKANTPTG